MKAHVEREVSMTNRQQKYWQDNNSVVAAEEPANRPSRKVHLPKKDTRQRHKRAQAANITEAEVLIDD